MAGLGGETDFTKIEASGRWYWPVYETKAGSEFTYSFAANLGYGFGDSGGDNGESGEELPLFERYFPGGITSVRGFSSRSLGPTELVCDDTGHEDVCEYEEVGGSQQLIVNNELIFPLASEAGLKGVVFFDAGNAFSAKEGLDVGGLRYTAGWGVRWLSPFGPLRVEVGFPLNAESSDDTSTVLFSFGTPF